MASSFQGWGNSWGNSWGGTVDPNAMQGSSNFAFVAIGNLSEVTLKGGGSGKKSRGWANERALFDLSQEVQQALEVFEDSGDDVALSIVEKIEDYSQDIAQFEALKLEFEKLNSRQYNATQLGEDMQQAAITLQEFLQDEQDVIDLLILVEDFDARCIITAPTQPFKW